MIYIISLLILLIIIFTINTLRVGGKSSDAVYTPIPAGSEAVERLSQAVRIPTVSYTDYSKIDLGLHHKFQEFLTRAFPVFHKTAERTVLDDFGLVYKWQGSSDEKKPVMFIAHYDVVPADSSKWTHEPFSGDIDDEFIWGRGTLDTKNTLMASLEAAETLCNEGFTPERTIYLAFGGDEEVAGDRGAKNIASWFKAQDITLDWLLDEGSITGDGLISGMIKKLSLIGTAEKGHVDILLKATASGGGHASMPPRITTTGRIARAVARLEARPFKLRWLSTTRKLFREMAAAGTPALKIALSNLWITSGLIKVVMGKNPASAALLRTTTAPTIITGSDKENVLAGEASAVVNVRILPGETIAGVLRRMEKVVADNKVTISILDEEGAGEPVPESSSNSEGYRLIKATILENIPDSVVLPFLVTVTTDSCNYTECCRDIFRYGPVILNQNELDRIHSVDERISLDNYGLCIRSYKSLMNKL
jgi:carboxypeptidase PM20D1